MQKLQRMTQELVAPGQGQLLSEDGSSEPSRTSDTERNVVKNLIFPLQPSASYFILICSCSHSSNYNFQYMDGERHCSKDSPFALT